MNDGILGYYLIGSLVFLFLFRWAHRDWGKAAIATVFAPLVIIPMTFVGFLAISLILRGINSVLAYADWDFSRSTIGFVALVLTSALLIVLLLHYCSDQRAVANIKAGPWMGVRYKAPEARGQVKRPVR